MIALEVQKTWYFFYILVDRLMGEGGSSSLPAPFWLRYTGLIILFFAVRLLMWISKKNT